MKPNFFPSRLLLQMKLKYFTAVASESKGQKNQLSMQLCNNMVSGLPKHPQSKFQKRPTTYNMATRG